MEPVANLGMATTIDLQPKIEADTEQGMVATKEQDENYHFVPILPAPTTTATLAEVATS